MVVYWVYGNRVSTWTRGNILKPFVGYGINRIAITPDGVVWYSESGMKPNTIVRFDPRTKAFGTWPIPSGEGVVRNMVSTAGGNLYIACSGVNKVGIVEVEQ